MALIEIKKLSAVEDALIVSEAKVKEQKTSNTGMKAQTEKLKNQVSDKEKELLEQGINITQLGKEVEDLKTVSKFPTFRGWKLAIMKILAQV